MKTLISVAKWCFLGVAAWYAVIVLATYYGPEEIIEVGDQIWSMLEIREGLMGAAIIGWLLCEVADAD